ncbi:MAG: TerB N-terminal domain-containing protein [Prevotella sp.]|nr:TerB N-terminal domain-containing protein [Prevotella sp.]
MEQDSGYTFYLDVGGGTSEPAYRETKLSQAGSLFTWDDMDDVPVEILRMQKMYEFGDGSYSWKCKNFYLQGKLMEHYEDDAPWEGSFKHYYTTYHDLNVPQLRGYFTWRTAVRHGEYRPTMASFAYIYLYELLNGIGCESVEDGLRKMRAFEAGYIDAGMGDVSMRGNLQRWMLELAVVSGLPAEVARSVADPQLMARDDALAVLARPEEQTDEAVFSALRQFREKDSVFAPLVEKGGERGVHLVAQTWRYAMTHFHENDKTIFNVFFDTPRKWRWRPLQNAIWWDRGKPTDVLYELNGCRHYERKNGQWYVTSYEPLYFDRQRIAQLLHATDLRLRRYLQTGGYLRKRACEEWAMKLVDEVIKEDIARIERELHPEVTVNLTRLPQIREDAADTRDSLILEEEETEPMEEMHKSPTDTTHTPDILVPPSPSTLVIDEQYRSVLLALLDGHPVAPILSTRHLLPSVVADAINEALFDEIGDNIVEYDGVSLTLVEDYEDDARALLTPKI